MKPFNYGYDLPCEFDFIGCRLRFYPSDFEAWIDHSLSHFGGHGLPPRTLCTFCDSKFHCPSSQEDTIKNWRRRLLHIGKHFYEHRRYDGVEVNHRGPDCFVLDHMNELGLIPIEDYNDANPYTQRPYVENTWPAGWESQEMLVKEERNTGTSYDSRKEEHRRKERDKRRGSQAFDRVNELFLRSESPRYIGTNDICKWGPISVSQFCWFEVSVRLFKF